MLPRAPCVKVLTRTKLKRCHMPNNGNEGEQVGLLPWYTPCANKRCDFTTPTICSTLGNTKVLVLDREEDPIALQPEDDWVLAKDLRQGEEKAMRKAMGGIGPHESYDWL